MVDESTKLKWLGVLRDDATLPEDSLPVDAIAYSNLTITKKSSAGTLPFLIDVSVDVTNSTSDTDIDITVVLTLDKFFENDINTTITQSSTETVTFTDVELPEYDTYEIGVEGLSKTAEVRPSGTTIS